MAAAFFIVVDEGLEEVICDVAGLWDVDGGHGLHWCSCAGWECDVCGWGIGCGGCVFCWDDEGECWAEDWV